MPGPRDVSSIDRTGNGETPELREAGARRIRFSPWNLLLVVPILVVLFPGLYNRLDPELGGIPFFYWFQLGAIAVGVSCTYVVYRMTRGDR
jgi:uncharacterized protein DUF3311